MVKIIITDRNFHRPRKCPIARILHQEWFLDARKLLSSRYAGHYQTRSNEFKLGDFGSYFPSAQHDLATSNQSSSRRRSVESPHKIGGKDE